MGTIHIDLFATLDLVGQAPGDPEEDPDGFPFGGWQAPLFDETVFHGHGGAPGAFTSAAAEGPVRERTECEVRASRRPLGRRSLQRRCAICGPPRRVNRSAPGRFPFALRAEPPAQRPLPKPAILQQIAYLE